MALTRLIYYFGTIEHVNLGLAVRNGLTSDVEYIIHDFTVYILNDKAAISEH